VVWRAGVVASPAERGALGGRGRKLITDQKLPTADPGDVTVQDAPKPLAPAPPMRLSGLGPWTHQRASYALAPSKIQKVFELADHRLSPALTATVRA
jgi:hypothetical protein